MNNKERIINEFIQSEFTIKDWGNLNPTMREYLKDILRVQLNLIELDTITPDKLNGIEINSIEQVIGSFNEIWDKAKETAFIMSKRDGNIGDINNPMKKLSEGAKNLVKSTSTTLDNTKKFISDQGGKLNNAVNNINNITKMLLPINKMLNDNLKPLLTKERELSRVMMESQDPVIKSGGNNLYNLNKNDNEKCISVNNKSKGLLDNLKKEHSDVTSKKYTLNEISKNSKIKRNDRLKSILNNLRSKKKINGVYNTDAVGILSDIGDIDINLANIRSTITNMTNMLDDMVKNINKRLNSTYNFINNRKNAIMGAISKENNLFRNDSTVLLNKMKKGRDKTILLGKSRNPRNKEKAVEGKDILLNISEKYNSIIKQKTETQQKIKKEGGVGIVISGVIIVGIMYMMLQEQQRLRSELNALKEERELDELLNFELYPEYDSEFPEFEEELRDNYRVEPNVYDIDTDHDYDDTLWQDTGDFYENDSAFPEWDGGFTEWGSYEKDVVAQTDDYDIHQPSSSYDEYDIDDRRDPYNEEDEWEMIFGD